MQRTINSISHTIVQWMKLYKKVSQLISEYAVQELQKQFERIKQTPGETEFLNESQPHLTRNN